VRPWKILCDFDGTVSTLDATDELLERCAEPEWKDFEREWRDGVIGSRECMSRQVALIDASERDLNRVLDSITIDPAFPPFVAQTRDRGLELVIVSDGLDRAIFASWPITSSKWECAAGRCSRRTRPRIVACRVAPANAPAPGCSRPQTPRTSS